MGAYGLPPVDLGQRIRIPGAYALPLTKIGATCTQVSTNLFLLGKGKNDVRMPSKDPLNIIVLF